MGRNTSSLTNTLKLRLRLRTWTRALGVVLWSIMLTFPHLITALAWAWATANWTIPRAYGYNRPCPWTTRVLWAFHIIGDYGSCHIWWHNPLHTLHGLHHTMHQGLDGGHFWFWPLSPGFQKQPFLTWLICSSACTTCTAALLRTGPLGGVWLSLGEAGLFRSAHLCSYSASISSIVGATVLFTCAASIISLNTTTRLAGWGIAVDWIGDVTTLAWGDTAVTLWTGDTLWSCTGLILRTYQIFCSLSWVMSPLIISSGGAFSHNFALMGSFTTRDRLFLWGWGGIFVANGFAFVANGFVTHHSATWACHFNFFFFCGS